MTPAALFQQWSVGKERLDRLAKGVPRVQRRIFRECSLLQPDFAVPELAFLRTVAYLYVHYFELGRAAITYCLELAAKQNWTAGRASRGHAARVNQLRTYLQHQLDFDGARDEIMIRTVEDWYYGCCKSRFPRTDDDYHALLCALLEEGVDFLEILFEVLTRIERDEDFAVSAEQLRMCIERYHAPWDFDPIIEVAKQDLGRDVNTVAFRNRHQERWRNYMALLGPSYSFETEARRLVEDALLADVPLLLPINGHDVMQELGVAPGPGVGAVLTQAREMYRANPRLKRDELLAELKASPAAD